MNTARKQIKLYGWVSCGILLHITFDYSVTPSNLPDENNKLNC